jgi:hypothetical protein
VQATIVMAQLKAAKDVEKRWADAQAASITEQERLAALKALVLGRMQAIKRSLYVAWTYYAASYFYLNFTNPPRVLHLDMNAAELGDAMVGVADWVARATGNASDGVHVQLPNNAASVDLLYDIVKDNDTPVTGDAALLYKAADGSWQLNFTLPYPSKQLAGVLSGNGEAAVWITEAAFYLQGATPNSKGNLLATIETSGTYQNAAGTSSAHTFVTKGFSGNYAYTVASENVYSPWKIDAAVYMTPTPYTQWTMKMDDGNGDPSTATQLKVSLTVSYLV